LAFIAGCARPSVANNKLRAENLRLQEEITRLNRELEARQATIRALEQRVGILQRLPEDRLDKLYTVHAIKLGRLTGGDNWDSSKPGDTGIKVAVTLLDQDGDKLKAAGSFVVDAFDLDAPSDPQRIGHWTFDSAQAGQHWLGALVYSYVLKCPWQQRLPTRQELTVRVTYTDDLTGRQFTQQQACKVNPPPTTTQAASRP
jgi:hypothetical protein